MIFRGFLYVYQRVATGKQPTQISVGDMSPFICDHFLILHIFQSGCMATNGLVKKGKITGTYGFSHEIRCFL